MHTGRLTRRSFLRGVTAGMAGLGWVWPKETAAEDSCPLVITEPFHGAVLNRHHGKEVSGGLKIRVAGRAAKNHRLTVNGTPARPAAAMVSSLRAGTLSGEP